MSSITDGTISVPNITAAQANIVNLICNTFGLSVSFTKDDTKYLTGAGGHMGERNIMVEKGDSTCLGFHFNSDCIGSEGAHHEGTYIWLYPDFVSKILDYRIIEGADFKFLILGQAGIGNYTCLGKIKSDSAEYYTLFPNGAAGARYCYCDGVINNLTLGVATVFGQKFDNMQSMTTGEPFFYPTFICASDTTMVRDRPARLYKGFNTPIPTAGMIYTYKGRLMLCINEPKNIYFDIS